MTTEKDPAPPAGPKVEPPVPPAPLAALPGANEEDILSAVVADAPKPEAAAPAPTGPEVEPRFAGLRDRQGNSFDPRLHLANEDGTPKLSPTGKLWGKPGVKLPNQGQSSNTPTAKLLRSLDLAAAGRAPGEELPTDPAKVTEGTGETKPVDQVQPLQTAPPPALTEAERRRLADKTAEMTVQLIQALGKFVAGKEGRFKRDDEAGDEHGDLKDAYAAWYVEMDNLVHISPGWVVAVHTGKYFARCAETETGTKRIEKGTRWIGSLTSKVRLAWHTWRATSSSR